MKIILIGNYKLDNQESMQRFADMLNSGFKAKGIQTEIWEPIVFFAFSFKSTTTGLGKWLGYIDKWILFPIIIRWRLITKRNKHKNTQFHICDHSNAPYLSYLPKNKTVITCHDVLAIRGALGYADAYCPASGMGKILQKWILRNLEKAKFLAAVSNFTLNQLNELSTLKNHKKREWVVIHNAFNAPFKPMNKTESFKYLKDLAINPETPFILHVGSALVRKNRKLLLYMVSFLGERWNGKIYFAGKPIDNELKNIIDTLGLKDRVISLIKPTHNQLLALYSSCEAFIFPSLSEGFGWPLIEAQACGANVIASSLDPMPEVSGGAAVHIHPDNIEGFAEALISLKDKDYRESLVLSGLKNIERFSLDIMIEAYINLHKTFNLKTIR